MMLIRDDQPRLKRVIFWTLVFSLAAHAYMYLNFAPTHDALFDLVAQPEEDMHQIGLGRFMVPVYWQIRSRLTVPWLVGLFSILFLTAGSYLLVCVLGMRAPVSTALLCGILSTNIIMTCINATFLPWADCYMLALLLAVMGTCIWERYPRAGTWAAAPLFAISMGLYQAYIDVAIGIALLLLIRHTLEGECFASLFRRALRYAVSLLLGAALYYALVKLSLVLTHQTLLNDYNGLAPLLHRNILSLLALIPEAYINLFWFFLGTQSYNPLPLRIVVIALGLLGVCRWAALIRSRHIRGKELIFLLLCAALLPLGLNFVYILSAGMIHSLMCYSYFLIYAVLLFPFEHPCDMPPPSGTDLHAGGRVLMPSDDRTQCDLCQRRVFI